jgi:hypothetical protein
VIAVKRRIEVTCESWRRIRIESSEPRLCPFCRGVAELASIPATIQRCGVSEASLAGSIRSGLLTVWQTKDGETAVCLGCVKRLN